MAEKIQNELIIRKQENIAIESLQTAIDLLKKRSHTIKDYKQALDFMHLGASCVNLLLGLNAK